jgi:hypothetical protein
LSGLFQQKQTADIVPFHRKAGGKTFYLFISSSFFSPSFNGSEDQIRILDSLFRSFPHDHADELSNSRTEFGFDIGGSIWSDKLTHGELSTYVRLFVDQPISLPQFLALDDDAIVSKREAIEQTVMSLVLRRHR